MKETSISQNVVMLVSFLLAMFIVVKIRVYKKKQKNKNFLFLWNQLTF